MEFIWGKILLKLEKSINNNMTWQISCQGEMKVVNMFDIHDKNNTVFEAI